MLANVNSYRRERNYIGSTKQANAVIMDIEMLSV